VSATVLLVYLKPGGSLLLRLAFGGAEAGAAAWQIPHLL